MYSKFALNITCKLLFKENKITENETCTYCESECETILHVFFMSTKVLHIGMI